MCNQKTKPEFTRHPASPIRLRISFGGQEGLPTSSLRDYAGRDAGQAEKRESTNYEP